MEDIAYESTFSTDSGMVMLLALVRPLMESESILVVPSFISGDAAEGAT